MTFLAEQFAVVDLETMFCLTKSVLGSLSIEVPGEKPRKRKGQALWHQVGNCNFITQLSVSGRQISLLDGWQAGQ